MTVKNLKDQFVKVLPYTLVVAFGLILYFVLQRFSVIAGAVGVVMHVLAPLFTGFVIAFLLNRPVMFFDRLLSRSDKKKKHAKMCRRLAVAIVYVLTIAALSLLISFVVPQIIVSIKLLIANFSDYAKNLQNISNEYFPKLKFTEYLNTFVSGDWSVIMTKIGDRVLSSLSTLVNMTTGITSSIVNFFIGFVFAVYMNCSKEKFIGLVNKLIDAVFTRRFAGKIREVGKLTNKQFNDFFVGKITDSIIIGVLCWICMTVFKIPYALLVSVIVCITNIIPVFGPFIGAVPSAFIILMAEPIKCVWFVVLIIVIQQLDGHIIGPHILGGSMGLDSFWILVAIVVGGGLWGVLGMIIGVPMFSVLFVLARSFVNDRLEKKGLPAAEDGGESKE